MAELANTPDEGTTDAGLRSPASMLTATSIAIVGASERSAWPSQIYRNLRNNRFAGRLQLVNSRQTEVFGERCYPSLRDLPEVPQHIAVIVPADAVAGVLEDAHAVGVGSATIYAAGIGDGSDARSKARGEWLAGFVARSGMRIAGPNCMGSVSYRERLFMYPNAGLCAIPAGPVGLAFQSGGTLQFFMQSGADRGLRYSYAVSTGNEPDLGLADYIDFMVADEHTHTIVLFIEGIRRPQAFMLAASRALAAGKPIIAIKTGESQGGAAGAQSHTGAIAGDYAAFLAMCERCGIVVCRSLDDLLETALVFQCRRWPKGPRIGFVTTSGGAVDLLHDDMEREGAPLAPFSAATVAALKPLMQEGIEPRNPLDAGIPTNNAGAADWCRIVLADDAVDMLGWATHQPKAKIAYGDVSPLAAMNAATDKPVIGFSRMQHQVTPEVREALAAFGFPLLQGLPQTVRAMSALWFYSQRQGRMPQLPAPRPKPSAKAASRPALTPDTLEQELVARGIHLPRRRHAATPADAAVAALDVGFPVALKIRSADIVHKTEATGVVLDLRSPETVEMAASKLLMALKRSHPQARIDGFLVQEMVSGVEAIVGCRNDPLYGPMLLVGSGGILVEITRDATLAMLPLDAAGVTAMVDRTRLGRLLGGYRGRPAADRAELEATVLALGQFYLEHRDRLADLEINPLIVRPDGYGVAAVDVRAIWK